MARDNDPDWQHKRDEFNVYRIRANATNARKSKMDDAFRKSAEKRKQNDAKQRTDKPTTEEQ